MVRVTFECFTVDTVPLLSNASGTFKPGAATRRTASSSHWTGVKIGKQQAQVLPWSNVDNMDYSNYLQRLRMNRLIHFSAVISAQLVLVRVARVPNKLGPWWAGRAGPAVLCW